MQRLIDANKICCMNCEECHENDICSTYNTPTVLTIPENPTNGDMITALIPIEDMWRGYNFERGKQVCVRFAHTEYVTCFDATYWDAPFELKKETTNDSED